MRTLLVSADLTADEIPATGGLGGSSPSEKAAGSFCTKKRKDSREKRLCRLFSFLSLVTCKWQFL
jgi:hypothetical protein